MSLLNEIRSMRFEVWDKWEEKVPQMDNDYWSWLLPDQKIPIKYGDETVVFIYCLYYTNTDQKNK